MMIQFADAYMRNGRKWPKQLWSSKSQARDEKLYSAKYKTIFDTDSGPVSFNCGIYHVMYQISNPNVLDLYTSKFDAHAFTT